MSGFPPVSETVNATDARQLVDALRDCAEKAEALIEVLRNEGETMKREQRMWMVVELSGRMKQERPFPWATGLTKADAWSALLCTWGLDFKDYIYERRVSGELRLAKVTVSWEARR